MKAKLLTTVLIVCWVCSACQAASTPPRMTDPPVTTKTLTPTLTLTPTPSTTPNPTETTTPTPYPTPRGQQIKNPMGRIAFFRPEDFELSSGIYRYVHTYAAIFQGEAHWQKAFIFVDLDISDQPGFPLSIYLAYALDNLDFFNASVDNTGIPYTFPTKIASFEAEAIGFSGETEGIPIEGEIIGFMPDNDHVIACVGWFDISNDPDIWTNEGIHLFHYIMERVVLVE